MKVLKKAATVVVSIILWAIILLAALFAFVTMATKDDANVASIAGFTPMVVQSDSMAPTFYAGDLIFIKACDPATLEVGDVICFHTIIQNEYALNTHRIAEIERSNGVRSYTTQGDNNPVSDTHVISDGDIVGKYIGHLSGFGKVIDFLSSSVGFLVVILLPLLLFFFYQIYHLIIVSINLKKAMAAQEAAELEMNADAKEDTEAMLAEAKRLRDEAEAALAEAKRLQADAGQTPAPEVTENESGGQAVVSGEQEDN